MSLKLYTSPSVDVSFESDLCIHSGIYLRGMPEVFNLKERPWVNAESADTPELAGKLIAVVHDCPSGALHIEKPETPEFDASEPRVANNLQKSRYEIYLDSKLAGFAEYLLHTGLITFSHTEIMSEFGGRGVGSILVKSALDEVRSAADRQIIVVCPFVKAYLLKHPEYADLAYRKRPDA